MAVKTLSGNKQIRHMKTRWRSGLNAASGNFPAGSKIRFIHSPGGRR